MRSPLRSCPRGPLAAVLAGSLLFTAAACDSGDNGDNDSGERSAGGSSPEQQDSSPAPDFTLSYDIPERWDPDSVAMVLESSMIGGGVNASGVVAGEALFVGENLNQVKRSTAEGSEVLDITPLKSSSVQQEDFRMEGFTRDESDYVALWRRGVPESNDSRRLGDENEADDAVFLTVLDDTGAVEFDGALAGAAAPGHITGGVAQTPNRSTGGPLTFDPLTGENLNKGNSEQDDVDQRTSGPVSTVVGYDTHGKALTMVSTPTATSSSKYSIESAAVNHFQTDDWSTEDLLNLEKNDWVELQGIAGDYAFFWLAHNANMWDEDKGREREFAIHIPDGEIVYSGEDKCFNHSENPVAPDTHDSDEKTAALSPDGSKVVRKGFMFDGDGPSMACDTIRGNFEPRIVLDDGTVYGYGERGSGDDATQVAASMKIGDEEALMEQGTLPIHVDDQGRGWFADSVNHSRGTDTVVAVVEPAEGGSRS